MSEGNRGYFFSAIFGLVVFSTTLGAIFTSLAQSNNRPESYPSYSESAAQTNSSTATIAGQSAVQAIKKKHPCDDPKGHDESDLCAQWNAASAATASAYWTWAGFWVGVVGAIGIIVSLFFTWDALRLARAAASDGDKSLDIAERNAKAAIRSVALAQENGEKALRAYIFVEDFQPEIFEIGKRARFSLKFRNIGKTPASDLVFWNQLDLYPVDADESVFVPELREGTSKSAMGQGQGGEGHFESGRDITARLWTAFVEGKAEFIAFGKIGYTDIFNIPRETTFRFRAKGGSDVVDFVWAPKGNHYT